MDVVVGAAVVEGGKVLAARRTAPPALSGQWEFPGGKVELGESEPEALARELREELSLEVEVGDLLGRVPLADGRDLAVYRCRSGSGTAQPGADHDQVRWLSAAELSSVNWVEADRLLLDAVRAVCTER
jgi:8-oxo-dGTP diphosphatase